MKTSKEKKKLGRPLGFKTPEDIQKAFEDYAAHIKANPIKQCDFVGKDGSRVERPLEKPLTIEGFMNYCDKHYSDVSNYFENPEGRYNQFKGICSRIRRTIREDQISGGMAGIYNPSITQRLNGLKEQVEQTNIEQPLFGPDKNK